MTFSKHWGIKAPPSLPPKYFRGTIPLIPPKSPPLIVTDVKINQYDQTGLHDSA